MQISLLKIHKKPQKQKKILNGATFIIISTPLQNVNPNSNNLNTPSELNVEFVVKSINVSFFCLNIVNLMTTCRWTFLDLKSLNTTQREQQEFLVLRFVS